MNAYLFFDPRARPLSIAGAILPGAKLKFFITTTTTPTPVYADAGLATPLGTTVTANDDGQFPPIYLSPLVTYRVQMYTADDVLLPDGDVDPLCPRPDSPPGEVKWFHGDATARDIAFPPALWQVLDGSNGTPDGRDRFPIIAGNLYASGDTGGSLTGTTTTTPAGAIGAGVTGDTALTSSMVPAPELELYVWESGGQGNAESFGTSGAHGVAGDNDHSYPGSYGYRSATGDGNDLIRATGGGSDPHHHSVPAIPDHDHDVTVDLPPYVALWALMRRS